MKFRRKAQVGGLQGFILSIITVAIVLAIGLIVLNELADTAKTLGITSVNNESITEGGTLSGGAELFIGASACRNGSMVAMDIGTLCNISSAGLVRLDLENFSNIAGFIDYSHYTPSAAFNSSRTILQKLATVPTWLGIIIIVALAFIVLSFFIGKRQ